MARNTTTIGRSGLWRSLLALGSLCLITATAACGESASLEQPPVSAFATGACRQAAADVLAAQRLIVPVVDHPELARTAQPALTKAQEHLVRTQRTPGGSVLTELVTAIGYFRLHNDTHTYRDSQARAVASASRVVIAHCTK
jgi:hypothetical protein